MSRIVFFAHYDWQAEVKRYVVHYLERLREVSDEMVFLSTSPLPRQQIDKVSGLVARTILRENVGYDFGMWQHAIQAVAWSGHDELVLTNSSVVGPIYPLAPLFSRMATVACDFWGMTESAEIAPHLQSYFLVFRKPVLESPPFRAFWNSVLPYRDKNQLIRSYELGLSVFLRDQGFTSAALVPSSAAPKRWLPRLLPVAHPNPTLCWPMTTLKLGMPFVKLELLRDNPRGIDLRPIHQAIEKAGYDLSLIEFDRASPTKRQR